ncbi:MAG: Kelch repeat-containing protein [Candidatus Thorarchaeota archaeon]|jgi:N-acetylneuraminic acid mutarotase
MHERFVNSIFVGILLCILIMGSIPLAVPNVESQVDSELQNEITTSFAASQLGFPQGRANFMMAYDIESDIIIIYGGWKTPEPFELGDTWSYDYNNDTYTNMNPAIAPPVREVGMMAYDSQSDKIVMFGGIENFNSYLVRNDTWTYDYNTNTWADVTSGAAPSPRDASGMVYDSESDRIILFGGENVEKYNDTWAYHLETNTWEQMNPSNSPSARYFPSMAYDEESDRVILFGGRSDGAKESDTWAYDYNSDSWQELSPSTQPSWRRGHFTNYDTESDSIVLFGGSDVSDVAKDDTWLFDYNSNNWTQVYPANYPSARLRHNMVYDEESDIILSFGGADSGYYAGNIITTDTTWAYDTNANNWTQMSSAPIEIELAITLVSHNPKVPTPDESVSVLAYIIDDSDDFSVDLQYKIGTADWTDLSMSSSGEFWSGLIPAQPEGTTVAYRVIATDGDANEAVSSEISYTVHDPSSGPSPPSGISLEMLALVAIVGIIAVLVVLIIKERR